MSIYTIYQLVGGEVVACGHTNATAPEIPLPEGAALLWDQILDRSVGYVLDGDSILYTEPQAVAKAAKPEYPARWDNTLMQWVDSRTIETQWVVVRTQRNKLLVASDWTQMPDAPDANKTAWATYRQALRDITVQADPFNIVWPVAPF